MNCPLCNRKVNNLKEFRLSRTDVLTMCSVCAKKLNLLYKFRPIKTAPRDGTLVWVVGQQEGSDLKYLVVGKWHKMSEKWVSSETGIILTKILYWYPVLLPYGAKELVKGV